MTGGLDVSQRKANESWGTRLFVVLPAVPNINGGLIENFFLL
jgi:hypothetical protein